MLRRFAEWRLDEAYPYLVLDTRYEKVHLDGVIQRQAVFVAIGINWDGRRVEFVVFSVVGQPQRPPARQPVNTAQLPGLRRFQSS